LALQLSYCGIGEPFYNGQTIHKYAADKFGSLFATARKLNKMMGENIVSGDLEVAIVGGGYPFNSEDMEEAYTSGAVEVGQRTVVCTTSLGLGEKKSGALNMILKPKVVLRDP
jgi:hypothetical protein